jgi:hypothetical protein
MESEGCGRVMCYIATAMFLYQVVWKLSRGVLCTCRQSRIVCHERNAVEGVQ